MYDPPYIERWYRMTGAYLAPPAPPQVMPQSPVGTLVPLLVLSPSLVPILVPSCFLVSETKTVDATLTAPLALLF